MSKFLVLSWQTFLMLKRDKIFIPMLFIAFLLFSFANLASRWGIEIFDKILFDIGFFTYHFTGALVAIFWGTKLISDAKKEGSLELELAAPVSRGIWLMSKFMGLVFALLIVGIIFTVMWQLLVIAAGWGWFKMQYLIVIALLTLEWVVVASLSIMFSVFTHSSALALFFTLCSWLIGLVSFSIYYNLTDNVHELSKKIVEIIAIVWNLQKLNLSDLALSSEFISMREIFWRCLYGVILIAIILSVSVFVFKRKDIIA